MRILVTDGDNRAALAITRSLGRRGHSITVCERSIPSLASVSSYCRDSFPYPDPSLYPEGFVSTLLKEVRDRRIEVIIPVADITTILLTEHRHLLEQYCIIPFPAQEIVNLAASKDKLISLAASLKVPVPKTKVIFSADEISDYPSWGLGFPVVIKPHRSRIKKANGQWLHAAVRYANDLDELKHVLDSKAEEYPLLLQQKIDGPGIGIFAFFSKGKMNAVFSHKRLREKPPSGGVSVLRESIPVQALASEFSEKLLKHLDWDGVAMVEFKLDKCDGIPKLMEINGRFWGSLQLAIDAGVDFPNLLVDSLNNDTPVFMEKYKTGVRTRWFWGDIDALLMVLFKRNNGRSLVKGENSKFNYLLQFLKSFFDGTKSEMFRPDDLRPWLFESCSWFRTQFQLFLCRGKS